MLLHHLHLLLVPADPSCEVFDPEEPPAGPTKPLGIGAPGIEVGRAETVEVYWMFRVSKWVWED